MTSRGNQFAASNPLTLKRRRNVNYTICTHNHARHFQSYLQRASQQAPAYLDLANVTGIRRIVYFEGDNTTFQWQVTHGSSFTRVFISVRERSTDLVLQWCKDAREMHESRVDVATFVHYLFAYVSFSFSFDEDRLNERQDK